MKIRGLQLENIGVFDDETIEFQKCPEGKAEIHIFTGENGTGKTTILQSLATGFSSTPNPHRKIDKRDLINAVSRLTYSEDERDIARFFTTFENFLSLELEEEKKNILINKFTDSKLFGKIHEKVGKSHSYRDNESVIIISPYPYPSERVYVCHECQSFHSYKSPYLEQYNQAVLSDKFPNTEFEFAVFAYSGYRQIQSQNIDAIKHPIDYNPLSQSLNFTKDYSKENEITINQLIANNISNRALSKEDGSFEESQRYNAVINAMESFIEDVVGYEVKFVLKRQPNELKLKIYGGEFDIDVLPDGLRSLISWIADLLGRIDLLKWKDSLPIFEKNLILFLDEIEVHLHPAWQRKVLPVVQKLFKNSQIFVSTHSPFVVNSIDDAWVYKLKLEENGKAKVADVVRSEDGISYQTVLSEIFGIDEEFGGKTQEDLDKFYKIVRNGKKINEKELLNLAKSLAVQSEELNSIVQIELRQLSRRKGKEYSL